MKIITSVTDAGLVLLLFVIFGQIAASFLVIRITVHISPNSLKIEGNAMNMVSYIAITENPIEQNPSGKTWHNVESWVILLIAVIILSSFNYLVFLREEDRNNLDEIKKEDIGRFMAKLEKWRRKIGRMFLQIKV
jgi:hypothetical protein